MTPLDPHFAPPVPLPDVLEGERVVLRPFERGDVTEHHVAWLNDPEVVRYSNQRFHRHTLESCTHYFDSFDASPNLYVSMRLKLPGGLGEHRIGSLTAYRSPHHGTADIGILLGERAVWGRGLGLEAWQLLCDWLLTTPGLRKLTAGTLACNRSMLAVAELSGMHREGVRRAQELVEGQPVDIVCFARFRAEGEAATPGRG